MAAVAGANAVFGVPAEAPTAAQLVVAKLGIVSLRALVDRLRQAGGGCCANDGGKAVGSELIGAAALHSFKSETQFNADSCVEDKKGFLCRTWMAAAIEIRFTSPCSEE